MAYQEKDREKWSKILIFDFMLSEERLRRRKGMHFCETHTLSISTSKQVFGESRKKQRKISHRNL